MMKDQLSALIDGEFDIESSEHLITSVKAGGELKSCWAQYHLIGDSMRGEICMSRDFSYRVISALEAEPTVLMPKNTPDSQVQSKKSQHKKTTQFWSVAASVAAVMFVGVMVMQQQLNKPEQLVPVVTAQRVTVEPAQLTPVEIAQSVPTEYLQAHQAAAPNGAAYYIQTASYTEPRK
jgi:sigma-E factor negative regulatory protein RseA